MACPAQKRMLSPAIGPCIVVSQRNRRTPDPVV